ncbi:hypothetical protein K2Z83_24455 [Oscillochloris sp. ZM17-4]|uniref:Gfo/Idh/MocA family protein n=1 Tax=Oscillochloris sp. ZM17-4 TaxID=2866714 RepID=UPI001C72EF56|nr:hypothetical protein [Oscillochloris sp. ZM17-4]
MTERLACGRLKPRREGLRPPAREGGRFRRRPAPTPGDQQYRWRYDATRANGVLGDLGSHMIDLARWCLGDPCGVSAHLATCVAREGAAGQPLAPANDTALLLLDMDSGTHASLHISAVGHALEGDSQLRVTIYGDAGTLEVDLQRGYLRGVRAGAAAEQLPVPDALWGSADRGAPFAVLFSEPVGARAFVDAARERRAVRPDFFDGLAAQIVVDAALASHAGGCRVAITDLPA